MTETSSSVGAADRLHQDVSDLHVPEPKADAEALLVKVGVALPVVGLVLIAVAWYNASGSAYVADQIPMLISGGLVGIGLMIIGAGLFLRFALTRTLRFWMARFVVEQQAQTDRLVEVLERVELAVRDATTEAPVVFEVPGQAPPAP